MSREIATFGAGCFWGVEELFSRLEGVIEAVSGYTGGSLKDPTYQDICTGTTGHAEVVQIIFDPEVISYLDLLNYFWRLHDPTTLNRQGYDSGTQYRSVIYYHNEQQQSEAITSRDERETSGLVDGPIVTEISAVEHFYKAEEYHQDYYQKKYEGSTGPICHFLRDK